MPGHTLSVSRHETIILINNWILLHYTYGRTCPAKWVAASSALANVCNQRGSCLSYLPHALAAAAADADIKMQLTFHYIATLRFRRGQLAVCVTMGVDYTSNGNGNTFAAQRPRVRVCISADEAFMLLPCSRHTGSCNCSNINTTTDASDNLGSGAAASVAGTVLSSNLEQFKQNFATDFAVDHNTLD